MNNDNLLGIFFDESRENLQILGDKLLELEKDPNRAETLNEIFRVAHTFKGMAKTMGFNRLSDLTHHLEGLLELLRSGQERVTDKMVEILFQGLDKIEVLMQIINETGAETECPAVTELVCDLEKILKVNEAAEEAGSKDNIDSGLSEQDDLLIKEALEKGLKVKEILVYIENDCVLPGVRAFMINQVLEKEGEIFKTVPGLKETENNVFLSSGNYTFVVKFYIVTDAESEELKEKIMSVLEIEKAEIIDLTGTNDEKNAEKSETADLTGNIKKLPKFSNRTIRVNAERLDNLMDLVGELVINKTRILELSKGCCDAELSEGARFLDVISGNIQEIVMKLRMVPVEQVFGRFPRLVRDISREMEKDVNLVIKGNEIEIDRAIVDEIAEPLIHLIRNSLDHGLESREERIKKGKKVKGTLQLAAINECGNILIKIIDDGRGIDPEKIREKILEKGLLPEEDLQKFTNDELFAFIFRPGFSTMEKPTSLSGRGVGMDVVKTKITSINGTVGIKSEKDVGTTVTISLPSTMAIIRSMIVEVGDEIYALPLNYVNEVVDIPVSEIKYIQNREVINYRDTVIPVKRLGELLKVPGYSRSGKEKLTLILMQSDDKHVAINVSRIINQQEIVIKNINKNLKSLRFISGVTTLGNGRVAPILNVNTLIN